MSKRKILLLAVTVCMVAILAVGGTLAYFTDDDQATNVFTVGNIDIDLVETFDEEEAKLILPGEVIEKAVNVTNTGSNPAYVRVHIAVPAILDSGAEDRPEFAAYNNTLHFNFTKASFADKLWSWLPEYSEGAGYKGNGAGNWNCYPSTVGDIDYNVYVVTYRTILQPGESTAEPAMTQVYLDTSLTQDAWNEVAPYFGEEGIKILVVAEGVQSETFEDAYAALNAGFGIPGTYNPWN